jgi:hypothetical protein
MGASLRDAADISPAGVSESTRTETTTAKTILMIFYFNNQRNLAGEPLSSFSWHFGRQQNLDTTIKNTSTF